MSLWYLPMLLKEKPEDLPRACRVARTRSDLGVLGVWDSLQREIFTTVLS